MTKDIDLCVKRNIHNRTEEDIKEIVNRWECTPETHIKINYKKIFDIQNVKETEIIQETTADKVKYRAIK